MKLFTNERFRKTYLFSQALFSKISYKSRLIGLGILEYFYSLFESSINAKRSPIFIAGCGHSGTTLMAALLNANPETKVIKGESYIFRYRNNAEIIRNTLSNTDNNQKRVVEKTPRHIRYLPRIFRLYPNARIILMLRDGRDVACSIDQRMGHHIMKGAARWNADNSCIEHWQDDHRVHILKLSELLDSPDQHLREVCKFLDLTWYADLLERHARGHFDYSSVEEKESEKSISKHVRKRNKQVNQPLKKYNARWVTELKSHQAEVLSYMLNENLLKFNYERNEEWIQAINL